MELIFETWPIDRCVDYARNPRKNDHAVDKVAAAIREFGFRVPIVAKSDGLVVDGHLRLKAAKKLGLTEVPVILADDMSEAQIKAFRLSVNKVAELAEWDTDLLGLEILDLKEMGFDIDLTGFDADEIGALFDDDGADDDTLPDQKELHATFEVAVECSDEAEQETVFNLLTNEGYKCRILTM
jgi:ParB-like chromosome segregation protein Spo0J